MNLKKLLAVILCVAAVLSVMSAVAYASSQANAVALSGDDNDFVTPTTKPPAPTTVPDNRNTAEKIADWWADFYPKFDAIWTVGFKGISDVLVLGFRVLLSVVGLGNWGGGTWLLF